MSFMVLASSFTPPEASLATCSSGVIFIFFGFRTVRIPFCCRRFTMLPLIAWASLKAGLASMALFSLKRGDEGGEKEHSFY